MHSFEETLSFSDRLINKITTYYRTIWKDRRYDADHKAWLENFKNETVDEGRERLTALYLLSKFMYFGNVELRELLKCLYRDKFKYPIIEEIRRLNGNTLDLQLIKGKFEEELHKTRFLGIGNPSESGVHLLYYFRQENDLGKDFFINTHEIFNTTVIEERDKDNPDEILKKEVQTSLKDNSIKRLIFIDDFCGSGTQAKRYSKSLLESIKALNPGIEISYLMLFGTEDGIKVIKDKTLFDRVESIFVIDKSFKCFSVNSRYFVPEIEGIDREFSENMCKEYGANIYRDHPLGHNDGQLLLSFFHNTPNNTLPIFWGSHNWTPMFKRFQKNYGL